MATGVYKLTNLVNGKIYVGGAYKAFHLRFYKHRWDLNRGTHVNPHLQRAWNKYGAKSFRFSILEHCEPTEVAAREQFWIDQLTPHDQSIGYNISPRVGAGYKGMHSPEGLRKISEANLGRKHPEEFGRAHSERMKGNKHLLGHQHSEETKKKISDKGKGRPASELCKQKSRERMIERNRNNPPRKGKKCSESHKRKVAEAALGRQVSEETRKKLSEAGLRRYRGEDYAS